MSDFYLRAAKVLDLHSIQNTSLKSLVKLNSKDDSDSKRLLKLVISTLEFLAVLRELIQITGIQTLENKAFGEREKRREIGEKGSKGKGKSNGKGKGKEKVEESDEADLKSKTSSNVSNSNSPSSTSLLHVLLHDLLFSPKKQISSSSSWPPKIALERHKARLKAELIKIQLRNGANRLVDLKTGGEERKISERIPRWIRINEPKIDKENCLEILAKSGWRAAEEEHDKVGVVTKSRLFHQTPHLESLICFHSSQTSQLLSHQLFQSGCIIMQDLASCFPARVLIGDESESNHLDEEDRFVDATSAPGNKTSHLSGLVETRLRATRKREGNAKDSEKQIARVSAFEHSPQRFKTLCKLLSKSGCLCDESEQKYQLSIKSKGRNESRNFKSEDSRKRTRNGEQKDSKSGFELGLDGSKNVEPILSDFLTTDPFSENWKHVSHMLLDPSCSGSGIVGRMDYLQESSGEEGNSVENENAEETSESNENSSSENQLQSRLLKLGEFQLKMIKHAMKFPSLRRFTYSTCSIHAEENEHVVLKALACEEAKSQNQLSDTDSNSIQKKFTPWRIAPRSQVIPTWSTRGIAKECNQDEHLADSLLRSIPGGDTEKYVLETLGDGEAHREACNGFFLALFIRDEIDGVEGQKELRKMEEMEEIDEEKSGEEDEAAIKKRKLNRKKNQAKKERKRKDQREREAIVDAEGTV